MVEALKSKILEKLKSSDYRPMKPRGLARELELHDEQHYHDFRDALKELMHQGRVVLGSRGAVLLPTRSASREEFVGTYHSKRGGFGFVVPTDPGAKEDLYIPRGGNSGAMTGDVVRAVITNRKREGGKALFEGRITEIIKRTNRRFVGTLVKQGSEWTVLPDGNTLTEPILTPDAASRHIKTGTKVVVELTQYPEDGQRPVGVISEVLGKAGEKDVDLRSVIVQYNLPEGFPDEVRDQARQAVDSFDPEDERSRRVDMSEDVVCTIDPEDAKDYDDAISLRRLENGYWQLGVHIADVSYFVEEGTPLDVEARERGNSAYFPGFVIPMLPEILSNGVCSLQEGVPRLCKSVFITYDDDVKPVGTKFVNTIITSAKRLRYREAQAIIDNADQVPHPDGARRVSDYPDVVVQLLRDMNQLAKRLQKRRKHQGQINLNLPEVELVLDEEGKVIDAVPEDASFTHTLIEMFMVEANEAVARLLDSLDVPFLRRTHPEPEVIDSDKLRQFVQVAGYKLPKELDRKAIQSLLEHAKGKPEEFAINLAILKSMTRAEYSPEPIGHYALASEHYCHYTSPIRRYADLTIHRLLDKYFEARELAGGSDVRGGRRKGKIRLEDAPTFDDLVELGRHISFTERRAEDAESELRQVKILTLLQNHIGEDFQGVVTGITNFGIFVQIQAYLVDGLIRYEDLMDDWWDVDERSGVITGQRTGQQIGIGDVVKARVVRVDVPRRELQLAVIEVHRKARPATGGRQQGEGPRDAKAGGRGKRHEQKRGGRDRQQQPAQHHPRQGGQRRQGGKQGHGGGESRRNMRPKGRSRPKR